MSNNNFVHLNVHSEFSVSCGIITIDNLVKAAKDDGMLAVAITDFGNLFGMIKFYTAAEKYGIKPIIGAELWVDNEQNRESPTRLTLLCQNNEGYKHLKELISQSYITGQYNGKPLVKRSWIAQKAEGLIAIFSVKYSDVGQAILSGNVALANKMIDKWYSIFNDRFYLGISRIGEKEEHRTVQAAFDIAEQKQLPLVAVNEVCFLKQSDFEAHEARVCINSGYILNDENRKRNYTEEQYFKTSSQMQACFSDIPEALENSVEIAKRCNVDLNFGETFLPAFECPNNLSANDYLIKISKEGLRERLVQLFSENKKPRYAEKDYHDRLDVELNVINTMGFAGYFLIVSDFIKWAKNKDIPVGPGRGSGAGSLVAYVLKITDLDPLEYDLLFERFLNPERVSMPDFDIDFCMEGRDKVIEYVVNKYGRTAVSQIITYGTMAAKAVVRDVGRVLNFSYGFVDKIAKAIPFEIGMTLDKALQEETLQKLYDDEDDVKLIIDLAKKLEGLTRNVGKHAGGVVIAPSKLTDFTPIYCEHNNGPLVTQFDKNDVEYIGLVKFDFLGLRTLTIIKWAVDIINYQLKKEDEEKIDISAISLTDEKTFKLLCDCKTTAVFQLESRGMKDLIKRLQPDNFEFIIALVALFRPGPLQSGMVDDFINGRHGKIDVKYMHPAIKSILEPTYGIILYQEQVMQIAQVLAGYTLGGADLLRRAMGKKKPEEMAKQRKIFVDGAKKNQVDEKVAEHIFDIMEKFAGYGFNKSHSAAYALITYQTAWLKTHYTSAFMAAVLSSDMANTDKVVVLIEECAELGLKVISPSVNQGHYKFSINDKEEIIYGLGAIKGTGESAITALVEERNANGPYKDLFDLCARVDHKKLSRRSLESLIKAGACDEFKKHRAELLSLVNKAIMTAEQVTSNKLNGQFDLFGQVFSEEDIVKEEEHIKPWSKKELLNAEKEALGLYLSGHPIEQYLDELSSFVTTRLNRIPDLPNSEQTVAGLITSIRTMQTKKGSRMAFVTLDDKTSRQEVVVFSELLMENKEKLNTDSLVIMEIGVKHDNYSGSLRITAKSIYTIPEARNIHLKYLCCITNINDFTEEKSEKFKNLLINNKDDDGCLVQLTYQNETAKAKLEFSKNWKVSVTDEFIEEMKELLGNDNVMLA